MNWPVTVLRRYPVKSMGGESLRGVRVDRRGLDGDRWYAVTDDNGRLASGKGSRRFVRRDAIFDYSATTRSDGQVDVQRAGMRWTVGDAALDRELSLSMRAAVRLEEEREIAHQDMGAISLVSTATLQWCAQRWGGKGDPRRLRTNLVIESDEPFIEEQWLGHRIQIGSSRLVATSKITRCRMIDIPQDRLAPGAAWLRRAAQDRQMQLGVYLDVQAPGYVELGDRAVLE